MRIKLIVLLVLNFTIVNAQFLIKKTGFDFSDFEDFNTSFLLQKKCKEIIITYSTKQENERILPNGQKKLFYLDAQGFVSKQVHIKLKDTVESYYYYKNNQLAIVRQFHENEIKATYFSYDTVGNKIKEVHSRETNIGDSRVYFKLGNQQIEWLETYQFVYQGPHQIKKFTYNDLGILFKEAMLYYNDSNKIVEENERFVVTGVGQTWRYKYNQIGFIVEKIFKTDVAGPFEEKTIFKYDDFKNIVSEIFFRNNIEQFENIYFYNELSKELETVLTKYPDTKTIFIKNILTH